MSDILKKKLVRTSFYPFLLELRSWFEYRRVIVSRERSFPKTLYCISPYKTGTTYFSGLFECKSMHEPLMYTTINYMNDSDFLSKPSGFLSLDLECSGFFADKLPLVRKFAPNSKVIFLSRHPEAWIGSVVNYFAKLDDKVSYNYVARLIFDPICNYPIENFYSLASGQQSHVAKKLVEYWIKVYSSGAEDDHSLLIPLDQLDERLTEVEEFTGLKAKRSGDIWKRENQDKKGFKLTDYIDPHPYSEAVRRLGYEL